jgi:hypothetical protein
MARTGKPWAVVITAVLSALIAASALATASALRSRGTPDPTSPTTTSPATAGVGISGCLVEPCTVLATVPVGGAIVELVVDNGGRSGRLRIGGGGASKVIEATITSMGATLTTDSLQCVPNSLSACLLHGQNDQGVVGQVAVGRSGKWSEITQPFQSDAGYLALADVTEADVGAEVLTAQHRCDRPTGADCSATPVYVEVYNLRAQQLGCTRDYPRLESLPGWPVVTLTSASLKPCA